MSLNNYMKPTNTTQLNHPIISCYRLIWQKSPTIRTKQLLQQNRFSESILQEMQNGKGFPDFVLTEEAHTTLRRFIKLFIPMNIHKRKEFADLLIEKQAPDFQSIQKSAFHFLAGNINDYFAFQTADEKLAYILLHPCANDHLPKLNEKLATASKVICSLLPEDLQTVAIKIAAPHSEKINAKMVAHYAFTAYEQCVELTSKKYPQLKRRYTQDSLPFRTAHDEQKYKQGLKALSEAIKNLSFQQVADACAQERMAREQLKGMRRNTIRLKPLWITAQKATPKKTFSAQKERGN